MTPRQALAYAHPCARAVEAMDDRFAAFVRPWFTIVTVNK